VSMSAGSSLVSVFRVAPSAADPVVNTPVFTFQPFGARFAGGASVAAADVGTFVGGVTRNVTAADGRSELVVASGAGMKATVLVYDLSGAAPRLVDTINPFGGSAAMGALTVTAGRYNNADTLDDLIISSGATGGSAIEVYSGRVDDAVDLRLAQFAPFANTAKKNASVYGVGLDTNRDGIIDNVVTGQGLGGNPGVTRRTSLTGTLIRESALDRSPLRLAALNSRPQPAAVTARFATLSALEGTGSIGLKQAAFAAYAAELGQVNADGTKRLRR